MLYCELQFVIHAIHKLNIVILGQYLGVAKLNSLNFPYSSYIILFLQFDWQIK